MKSTEINLGDLVIQINRKPIKHLYVKVKPPHGEIVVHVPIRAKLSWIQSVLESKQEWLQAQQQRLQCSPKPSLTLEAGTKVPFLGKEYELQIDNSCRLVYHDEPLQIIRIPNSDLNDRVDLINCWYKQKMQDLLPPLIEKWENIIGVKISAHTIRLMKTRWGSCNTRTKKINLNLKLMQKPLSCIEYVLVHELIHLLESRHNQRFYELMQRFMPDWRTHQALLEPGRRCFR